MYNTAHVKPILPYNHQEIGITSETADRLKGKLSACSLSKFIGHSGLLAVEEGLSEPCSFQDHQQEVSSIQKLDNFGGTLLEIKVSDLLTDTQIVPRKYLVVVQFNRDTSIRSIILNLAGIFCIFSMFCMLGIDKRNNTQRARKH